MNSEPSREIDIDVDLFFQVPSRVPPDIAPYAGSIEVDPPRMKILQLAQSTLFSQVDCCNADLKAASTVALDSRLLHPPK